jgi:hypothetical protein
MQINNRLEPRIAFAAAAIVGAVFLSTSANASSIPVGNATFETLPGGGLPFADGQGGFYSTAAIPDWTSTDPAMSGQWQPGGVGSTNHYFSSLPNPPTIAYANDGTISQGVGNAVAGATYTLQVDVGARADGLNVPPTVDLLIGGQTITATGTYPSLGTWAVWTATGVATSDGAITIDLISNGSQADFDNVTLTATPLPSTWTMLFVGLLGLGYLAHRGSKQSLTEVVAA